MPWCQRRNSVRTGTPKHRCARSGGSRGVAAATPYHEWVGPRCREALISALLRLTPRSRSPGRSSGWRARRPRDRRLCRSTWRARRARAACRAWNNTFFRGGRRGVWDCRKSPPLFCWRPHITLASYSASCFTNSKNCPLWCGCPAASPFEMLWLRLCLTMPRLQSRLSPLARPVGIPC